MYKSKFINKCLISRSRVTKIIDLGMHPFADTFISKNQLHLSEPVFPLQCYLSIESGHIQVGYVSNDFDRYNLYHYSYTSSNSIYARNHWDDYSKQLMNKYNLRNKNILEVGCNDSYLLKQFSVENITLGVDSSKDMCNLSKKLYGFKNICGIFSYDLSKKIKKNYKKFDLICANNVLNHANEPNDFISGVKNLLADGGIFVYELPYWGDTIKSLKFDQIYHEHVSYFTVKSSYNLLLKNGLQLIDVEFNEYHGGSIRVFAKKAITKKITCPAEIAKLIKHEEKLGLFKIDTYKKFKYDIDRQKFNFLKKFYEIKQKKIPIIGVGSAAKANTFLNFYDLSAGSIDFITDSSDFKIGKFTPLTRIPIVGDDIFKKYDKVYALILSWNISKTLKEKILKINPKVRFI